MSVRGRSPDAQFRASTSLGTGQPAFRTLVRQFAICILQLTICNSLPTHAEAPYPGVAESFRTFVDRISTGVPSHCQPMKPRWGLRPVASQAFLPLITRLAA